MTTATPKPDPVPAILVYGTPSGPAFPQASWFRGEDKEAVKAAANELKFSVIELHTDADRALAAGAHEGVLKGSGRMIVGSVSAEIYRRIEEHARQGASASDPSKAENAAAILSKSASEQSKNNDAAGRPRRNPRGPPRRRRPPPSMTASPHAKPCGSARGSWPHIGTRSANSKAFGSPSSSASSQTDTASSGSRAGISAVQKPAPRHRRAAPRVPPLRQVTTRNSIFGNAMGRPAGRPLHFGAHAPKPASPMQPTTSKDQEP
jgi:hypothetical protein